MALTFETTIIHESVFGNKRVVTADVVSTGTGTATTAADVGYHIAYDYVNEKLVYTHADGDAGAHVVTTSQLTNCTVRVMAVGY